MTTENFIAYEHASMLFRENDNATKEHALQTGVLEYLIDRFGIATVLSAMADVAHEKAEHAQTNGDKTGALQWIKTANAINKTALNIP